MAVNLSARDLADPSFSAQIGDWLATAAVPASALTLELTEASAIADRDLGISNLTQLRSRGIRTSLDDFGSGYSSLAYLSELPLDEMKLDQGFLTGQHGTDSFVLRSVIDIGHHLGLTVVAEGVETPEDLARLGSLGADVAQGYLLAEPMFGEEFLTLLRAWPTTGAPAWIYADDVDAVYARAVGASASVKDEPTDQVHGARQANVTDPPGTLWGLVGKNSLPSPDVGELWSQLDATP